MDDSLRFGPAVSAIALATVIAGCATPQTGVSGEIFGGKVDTGNIGLATRAMVALNANDYATAINLAERAVENSPRDAGFRALLGNAYFGAGRFASAEAAYSDSLSLYPGQRQVVLKSVLVRSPRAARPRRSKRSERLATSLIRRTMASPWRWPANRARPCDLLEAAARDANADGRVRQNLALAHALSGDWEAARAVASQDLAPDLVDARIQQWMTFAVPHAPVGPGRCADRRQAGAERSRPAGSACAEPGQHAQRPGPAGPCAAAGCRDPGGRNTRRPTTFVPAPRAG